MAAIVDPAGDLSCLLAGSDKDVGAARAPDRGARILCDHQPAKGRLSFRRGQGDIDPDRKAVGPERVIDRDAASGRDRNALRAERPVTVRASLVLTKEYVRFILAHQ